MNDSKYGFSLPGQSHSEQQQQSISLYSGGASIHQAQPSSHMSPPDLPPRVDRNIKPTSSAPNSRGTLGRSAQERLFNKADSVLDMANYINATPHRANTTTSSLERPHTQPKTVISPELFFGELVVVDNNTLLLFFCFFREVTTVCRLTTLTTTRMATRLMGRTT